HLESTKFHKFQQALSHGSGPGGRWFKSTRPDQSFSLSRCSRLLGHLRFNGFAVGSGELKIPTLSKGRKDRAPEKPNGKSLNDNRYQGSLLTRSVLEWHHPTGMLRQEEKSRGASHPPSCDVPVRPAFFGNG